MPVSVPEPVTEFSTGMEYFDHEKLDVYKAAIEFVSLANTIIEKLQKGKAYLADQLQRAGSSVPLNIAEGAGEFSPNEKARFYRIARRSATECAAILDVCKKLSIADLKHINEGRQLLLRTVSMLTKLVHAQHRSGMGKGTST